jgi:hypothetical protein
MRLATKFCYARLRNVIGRWDFFRGWKRGDRRALFETRLETLSFNIESKQNAERNKTSYFSFLGSKGSRIFIPLAIVDWACKKRCFQSLSYNRSEQRRRIDTDSEPKQHGIIIDLGTATCNKSCFFHLLGLIGQKY